MKTNKKSRDDDYKKRMRNQSGNKRKKEMKIEEKNIEGYKEKERGE